MAFRLPASKEAFAEMKNGELEEQILYTNLLCPIKIGSGGAIRSQLILARVMLE